MTKELPPLFSEGHSIVMPAWIQAYHVTKHGGQDITQVLASWVGLEDIPWEDLSYISDLACYSHGARISH